MENIFLKGVDIGLATAYYINVSETSQATNKMKVKVLALTIGEFFTDGQSIVSHVEAAYKHPEQIEYYLSTAKNRGLDFGFQEYILDIDEEDLSLWQNVYGATKL